MNEKTGPTEFQAEVQRLHAAGKLPKLEDLLDAIVEIRKGYASKILDARKQGEQSENES